MAPMRNKNKIEMALDDYRAALRKLDELRRTTVALGEIPQCIREACEAAIRRADLDFGAAGKRLMEQIGKSQQAVSEPVSATEFRFEIQHPGEGAAGWLPYTDVVRISFHDTEFDEELAKLAIEHFSAALSQWFDGATVTYTTEEE